MLSKNSVIFLICLIFGGILIFFWTSHNLLKKNIEDLNSSNNKLIKENKDLGVTLLINENQRLSLIKEREDLKAKNIILVNNVSKNKALIPLIKKEYVNLSSDTLKEIIITKYKEDSIAIQDSTVIKDGSELIQIPKKVIISSISKFDEVIVKNSIINEQDSLLNNKDIEIKNLDTQIGTYKNDSSVTNQIITNDNTIITNKDSEIKVQKKIIRNQKIAIIAEVVLNIAIIIISL